MKTKKQQSNSKGISDDYLIADPELHTFVNLFLVLGIRITSKRIFTCLSETIERNLFKLFRVSLSVLNLLYICAAVYSAIKTGECREYFIYTWNMISVFFLHLETAHKGKEVLKLVKRMSMFSKSYARRSKINLTRWFRVNNIGIAVIALYNFALVINFSPPKILLFGQRLENNSMKSLIEGSTRTFRVIEMVFLDLCTNICTYFCCYVYIKEKILLQTFSSLVKEILGKNSNSKQRVEIQDVVRMLSGATEMIKDTNDLLSKTNFCVICGMLTDISMVISDAVRNSFEDVIDKKTHLSYSIANAAVTVLLFTYMIVLAARVPEEYYSLKIAILDSILLNPSSFTEAENAVNISILLSVMESLRGSVEVSSMRLFNLEKSVILQTIGGAITYGAILIQIT